MLILLYRTAVVSEMFSYMYCMPGWVILQTYVTDVKCSGCFCPFHLNAKTPPATIHFNVPVLFTICCGKTVYVGLSLYTNTVGFKSSNQHVIKKQIFSFNSKTFANILNKLFKNYSNLYTYTFTYF